MLSVTRAQERGTFWREIDSQREQEKFMMINIVTGQRLILTKEKNKQISGNHKHSSKDGLSFK